MITGTKSVSLASIAIPSCLERSSLLKMTNHTVLSVSVTCLPRNVLAARKASYVSKVGREGCEGEEDESLTKWCQEVPVTLMSERKSEMSNKFNEAT